MNEGLPGLYHWSRNSSRHHIARSAPGQILRRDPLQESARVIAYQELRVWFEPNWRNARQLAAWFPWCLICSIPPESDTDNLHKTPGWRRASGSGASV